MISGHLDIADGTRDLGGDAGLRLDPRAPGVYTGAFPALPHREWKQVASQTRRLRELADRVSALEQRARRRLERAGDASQGRTTR